MSQAIFLDAELPLQMRTYRILATGPDSGEPLASLPSVHLRETYPSPHQLVYMYIMCVCVCH